MNRAQAREYLLGSFKPKQMDISTPYFPELDGKLRLVGLSGKEGINLKKSCTLPNGVLDEAKFSGMLIVKCLRLRDAHNTPVFEDVDAQNLTDEIGLDEYNLIGEAVLNFVGMKKGAIEEAKKNSETTLKNSSSSSLPADFTEPLMNSLPASIPAN